MDYSNASSQSQKRTKYKQKIVYLPLLKEFKSCSIKSVNTDQISFYLNIIVIMNPIQIYSSNHHFQLQSLIGKGSFGQIYKATRTNQNKTYAIKILQWGQQFDTLQTIQKEIRILMSCNHPNIVKCHSVEIVEESVWIVMDYCKYGSLSDIMNKRKKAFTQKQIKFILKEILHALAYLHNHKIIHRDIKAANILLDSHSSIKIADFGVSTLLSQTKNGKKNTRTGSPFWMSPQLLSKSQYTYKTDIWSLGITAIELAEGAPPYSYQHPYRAIFSIQSHPPQSLANPSNWSKEFNNFVKRCLTINEKNRPSAKQLLEDEFLKNCSSNTMIDFNEEMQKYDKEKSQMSKGTVILHEQKSISIWQKQNGRENDEECGTFFIKQGIEKGMNDSLLNNITKKNKNRQENLRYENQIGGLYKEMELELCRVRQKYIKKIKDVEEKNFPTFSHYFQSKSNDQFEEDKKQRFKHNKQNLSCFKI